MAGRPKTKRRKAPAQHKVFATNSQIVETKSEISTMERMFKADRASGRHKLDEGDFRRELAKKQKYLREVSPKKLTGTASNKALSRAKKLEKQIREAMPSNEDYFQPESNKNKFDRAVRQQMAFQTNPDLQAAVNEYKHLVRRLDPSDPTLTNIERLRR